MIYLLCYYLISSFNSLHIFRKAEPCTLVACNTVKSHGLYLNPGDFCGRKEMCFDPYSNSTEVGLSRMMHGSWSEEKCGPGGTIQRGIQSTERLWTCQNDISDILQVELLWKGSIPTSTKGLLPEWKQVKFAIPGGIWWPTKTNDYTDWAKSRTPAVNNHSRDLCRINPRRKHLGAS